MEFKGTKGDWVITEISKDNSFFIESGDECIGTVWKNKQGEANAKLIASAPDLLESLEKIMSISNDSVVIRIASKAINKALN